MSKFKLTPDALNLLDSIVNPNDQTVKLSETSPLASFDLYPDIQALIASSLSKGIRRYDHTATLFNAIFTQKTGSFIMSRDSFSRLLKNDENHKTTNCNGKNWAIFREDMIDNSQILVVVEPQVGTKPAFFKVNEKNPIFTMLANYVGKSIIDEKYSQNYKYFKSEIKERNPEAMSKEDAEALTAASKAAKAGA